MLRSILALTLCVIASPAFAVEVVLRDSIGPDGTATHGRLAMSANTNGQGVYAVPGSRVLNSYSRPVHLREARFSIVASNLGTPINDINQLAHMPVRVDVWLDGLTGPGDTYDRNPAGATPPGSPHTSVTVDYSQNSALSVLQAATDTTDFSTFMLSTGLTEQPLRVDPGEEIVVSALTDIVEGADSSIGVRASVLFYAVDGQSVEDVFQNENTLEADRPGFVFSQLGLNAFNYGVYVSAEFLEGDYNGDGAVDAADYTVWRDNEGATGLAAWSPGDGDGDGDLDPDDYQAWRDQYGMTLDDLATSPASSTTIPEPASLLLVIAAASLARR
ncbi:MAG: hypothetical protein AAF805_06910 [Planctomycetota bacterium]